MLNFVTFCAIFCYFCLHFNINALLCLGICTLAVAGVKRFKTVLKLAKDKVLMISV